MACPSSMASERKPPELTPSTTFDNISWAPAYGVVLIVFDRVFSSQTETVTVPPMEVANIRPRRWFQYSVFSF